MMEALCPPTQRIVDDQGTLVSKALTRQIIVLTLSVQGPLPVGQIIVLTRVTQCYKGPFPVHSFLFEDLLGCIIALLDPNQDMIGLRVIRILLTITPSILLDTIIETRVNC
jgi:hypothetical protein